MSQPQIKEPPNAGDMLAAVIMKWSPIIGAAASLSGRNPTDSARAFAKDVSDLMVQAFTESRELALVTLEDSIDEVNRG